MQVKSQNYEVKGRSDLRGRCYSFSLQMIRLAGEIPYSISAKIILDQLIRSVTSIGANLIEARAASSRREYKKFYEISLKSANETKYWLGLLRDAGLADREKVNILLIEVGELSNMLASGVMKLKQR